MVTGLCDARIFCSFSFLFGYDVSSNEIEKSLTQSIY